MALKISYAVERYKSTTRQWNAYTGGISTLQQAKKEAKGLSSSYGKKHRVVKEQIMYVYDEKGKLVSR